MERIAGSDLLKVIQEGTLLSRTQLLRITGYVRIRKDGTEVLDSTAFNRALMEAIRDQESQKSEQVDSLRGINEGIVRTMIKTVIALPLVDQLDEELKRQQEGDTTPARVYDIIISLHQDFPKGRESARRWVIKAIEEIIKLNKGSKKESDERIDTIKRKLSRQYLFASLTAESIRKLVLEDGMEKATTEEREAAPDGPTNDKVGQKRDESIKQPAIFQIWEDFKIYPMLSESVATVKADAAQASFGASGKGIVWAVIDSGIQADHPHFTKHKNLEGLVDNWHADFTGNNQPLVDGFGHGTHVAGIIAGEIPAIRLKQSPEDMFISDNPQIIADNPEIIAYKRLLKSDHNQGGLEVACERLPLASIRGVAPETKLVSMKVIDSEQEGSVSNIIAALARIQEINSNGRNLLIHGINLSVGYPFNPEWFACGQSQLCVEVNRLVQSGVVVVVAAGNTGYGTQMTAHNGPRSAGLPLSINDPGNAEAAITVGSTHRTMPHTYGVSYFSSKGPTGDGRLKPDLVAPGEKILSCGVGTMATRIATKIKDGLPPNYVEDSGTSMAAPHVSGAVAAFLSIRNEFIGKPNQIKSILMDTATDLKRERQFQGAGLLDLMRAIQSL